MQWDVIICLHPIVVLSIICIMKASIITVGDEILIGQIIDSNSAWMGTELNKAGIEVRQILSVGDVHDEIKRALTEAATVSDIILMTGGLGPTEDDLTIAALADFLGVGLYFDEPSFVRIRQYFERLGRSVSEAHKTQCYLPQGAEILKNKMGTAPGMLFRKNGKIIISMPGVPYEMKYIMETHVLPMLKEKYSDSCILHHTLMTAGEGESVLADRIKPIVQSFPDYLKMAYLPSLGVVRLRITARGKDENMLREKLQYYAQKIEEEIADVMFADHDTTLEKALGELCKSRGIMITTAESCTGGTVASRITSVPGSSTYFTGGVVSYSNELKMSLLKVNSGTLQTFGAVSEQTVREMVQGALKLTGADAAVSVSGIAGPDGGTEEKPVGTIWIAVGNNDKTESFLIRAGKDRSKNIEYASNIALFRLWKFVKEHINP